MFDPLAQRLFFLQEASPILLPSVVENAEPLAHLLQFGFGFLLGQHHLENLVLQLAAASLQRLDLLLQPLELSRMGHATPVEARLLGSELLPHCLEIQLLLAEPASRVGSPRLDLAHPVPRFDQLLRFTQRGEDRLQSIPRVGELDIGVLEKVEGTNPTRHRP